MTFRLRWVNTNFFMLALLMGTAVACGGEGFKDGAGQPLGSASVSAMPSAPPAIPIDPAAPGSQPSATGVGIPTPEPSPTNGAPPSAVLAPVVPDGAPPMNPDELEEPAAASDPPAPLEPSAPLEPAEDPAVAEPPPDEPVLPEPVEAPVTEPIDEPLGGGTDVTPEPEPEPEPEPQAGLTELEPFSFFVTSLESMRNLSGSESGFGGDLSYGEASGLAGADKICTEIAEISMPGAAAKQWRAFLSVSEGPVHAIERIGEGPWYDRQGRLVADDVEGLLNERPDGHAEVSSDLPNEFGEPNHTANGVEMDNHDTLTGSDEDGRYSGDTCDDWMSTTAEERPMAGHSWPANSGRHWIRAHQVAGCAPSVVEGQGSFGGMNGGGGVGDGGGYGGIYCFALSP